MNASAPSVIEVSDDRLRKISELVERSNNLPVWEISDFAQAYLRGDFNLGLRCSVLGDEANYGFIWSAAHPSRGYGVEGFRGTRNAGDVDLRRVEQRHC
jgi:hypothetical protein